MEDKPNKGVIVDVVTGDGQQPSAEKMRELQEYIDSEYYGTIRPKEGVQQKKLLDK